MVCNSHSISQSLMRPASWCSKQIDNIPVPLTKATCIARIMEIMKRFLFALAGGIGIIPTTPFWFCGRAMRLLETPVSCPTIPQQQQQDTTPPPQQPTPTQQPTTPVPTPPPHMIQDPSGVKQLSTDEVSVIVQCQQSLLSPVTPDHVDLFNTDIEKAFEERFKDIVWDEFDKKGKKEMKIKEFSYQHHTNKETALFIFPGQDHNGALNLKNTLKSQILSLSTQYSIKFIRITNVIDFLVALTGTDKIGHLYVAGHGTPHSINFGPRPGGTFKTIPNTKFSKHISLLLKERLCDHAAIFTLSCSNGGQPTQHNQNMANFFASLAQGHLVFASKVDFAIAGDNKPIPLYLSLRPFQCTISSTQVDQTYVAYLEPPSDDTTQ